MTEKCGDVAINDKRGNAAIDRECGERNNEQGGLYHIVRSAFGCSQCTRGGVVRTYGGNCTCTLISNNSIILSLTYETGLGLVMNWSGL